MSKLYLNKRLKVSSAALLGLLMLAGRPAQAGTLPARAMAQPAGVLRTQAVAYSEQGTGTLPMLPFVRRVVFDADGDGDQDLLYQTSANTTGADIYLKVNNGSGDYATTYAASATGTFSSGPLNGASFTQVLPYTNNAGLNAVDIDNDGDQDLVEYTNATAPRVIFNGRGKATVGTIATLPTLAFGTRHVFYDADGDGDQDIVYQTTANTTGADIYLKLNGGNGTFATTYAASATGTFSSGPLSGVTFTQILPAASAGGLDPVDIDNDGDQDLVEYGNATAPRVILNNRSASTASTIATLPTLAFGTRHVFFDVDSDGDQDIVYQTTASTTGADIYLKLNGGSGTFATTYAASATGTFSSGPLSGITFAQVLPYTSSGGISPVDYDNDRDADVVVFTNALPTRVVRQENTRPLLVSSTPADNATGVNPATNIVLTFDRNVVKGTGNLYLVRTADNTVVETTAIGSSNVTGAGTTWTYNPVITLANTTGYALRADDEIFRDADSRAFAGIFDNTTLNFTTGVAATTLASINRAASSPTNASTVAFTVTFAAAVSGLTISNFALATTGTVTGASISSVSAGPASVYTVVVSTGTGDGTLGLNLANAANLNPTLTNTLPVVGQVYTLDKTAPTATISSSAGASTTTAPIPFGVQFSESVTGFTLSSVSVVGGAVTPGSFAGSGSGPYLFTVTPQGTGNVSVSLRADVAQDAVGNGNIATAAYTLAYSQPVTTAPSLDAPLAGTLTNNPRPTFSGTAPAGSTVTVYVDNTSVGTVVATAGSWRLTPTSNLPDGAHVARATAQLSGFAGSPASAAVAFTTDTVAPTVTVTTPSSTVLLGPIPFTVTFSEDVTGFTAASVSVSEGTVRSVSGSGRTYVVSVVPEPGVSPVVSVTVTVPANAVQDLAGNGNLAPASPAFVTYITPISVFSIKRLDDSPSSAASVRYQVLLTYKEPGLSVSNFDLTTTGLSDARIVSLTGVGGTYVVTVSTGTGSGTLRLNLTNNVNLTPALDNLPFAGETYEIRPVVPCAAPTAVTVDQVAATTARVSFAGSSTATGGYVVTYTPSGGTAQTATASTSPVTLTGLLPSTTYSLTVTSACGSGQTATSAPAVSFTTPAAAPTLRVPENPSSTVAGLEYQYYEAAGSYTKLPDFAASTPLKTGTTTSLDVKSLRQRDYAYALRFVGYVTVPADGQYTFFTSSDDGSRLFIGSQLVVDNDGEHQFSEQAGTIGLQAGTHALTIAYFQSGGAEQLQVSYQGPGTAKQLIPASSLRRASPQQLRTPENPAGTVAGLEYQYYEAAGSYTKLPDFAASTPLKTGTTTSLDVKSLRQRDYAYALRFVGYVTVPADGQYTFFTSSDDGSRLFIGSQLVVDNDGEHQFSEQAGTIGLQAGTHALTIAYFQSGGAEQLQVSYQGPGTAKQLIPASSLRRVPATMAARQALGEAVAKPAASAALVSASATWQAYPNPFTTTVTLEVALPQSGDYSLTVYDATGRLVEELARSQAAAGEVQHWQWAAANYPSGLYLLRLRTATGTQQLRIVKK